MLSYAHRLNKRFERVRCALDQFHSKLVSNLICRLQKKKTNINKLVYRLQLEIGRAVTTLMGSMTCMRMMSSKSCDTLSLSLISGDVISSRKLSTFSECWALQTNDNSMQGGWFELSRGVLYWVGKDELDD